jgi:hypothetical protein
MTLYTCGKLQNLNQTTTWEINLKMVFHGCLPFMSKLTKMYFFIGGVGLLVLRPLLAYFTSPG